MGRSELRPERENAVLLRVDALWFPYRDYGMNFFQIEAKFVKRCQLLKTTKKIWMR
jgi:hypothetical protein